MYFKIHAFLIITLLILSCAKKAPEVTMNFVDDINFLKKYTDVIELKGQNGLARLAVVPEYQGRVMTSTADGPEGKSFGWINYDLISSRKIEKHINVFGGEDRFWLGPEGGQFSIFFKKDDSFNLDNWYVPKEIDTEPFKLIKKGSDCALFQKEIHLVNYADYHFNLEVKRKIKIVDANIILGKYNIGEDDLIKQIAYSSINQIKNTGENEWMKETGMLSIWILAMLKHSPNTTVVIPYNPGSQVELGPIVNDAYFGEVSEDRLKITDKVVYFKGDGQYRSKIGLSAKRSKAILGSYNADDQVLTIIEYNKPENETEYVNSLWEIQDTPFEGDVVNSYNDGPAQPGAKPYGPFYELETSSPAAALTPGDSMIHIHNTIHLTGPEDRLDLIAQNTFGVSLSEIKHAFR